MSVTIEDMLKINKLSALKVLAGAGGIKREIRSVTVMDAPDIKNWVEGGELLLTTGYCIRDSSENIVRIIHELHNCRAAAFAIKLNRFIDELPEAAVEAADKLCFPIIQIPMDMKYIEIINPVFSEIINEQSRKLQFSEKIHNSFTQLIINGGGPQKIINTLKSILDSNVAFYDAYYERKYVKSDSRTFSSDIKTLSIDKLLAVYYSYQVYLDKKNYGYIILTNDILKNGRVPEYDKIAIEHASTALKFDMQKNISRRQVEAGFRQELVIDLVIKNIKTLEEVNVRSNLYGWDFSRGAQAVIVDIDNFKKQYSEVKDKGKHYNMENIKNKVFEEAIRVLKDHFSQVPYTKLSDSIVFLITPSIEDKIFFNKQLKDICLEIRNSITAAASFTVTIGAGNYEPSIMDVWRSCQNAKMAVKFGRLIHRDNGVVLFDDLGIYKLLSMVYQSSEAKEYYSTYLQKLMDYDERKNGELIETLRCIVRNSWNLRAASAELYIHYNTMKHRFNKIEELLEVDLGDNQQRTNIDISLKLMDMAE